MADNLEIIPRQQKPESSNNWLSRKFQKFTNSLAEKREAERVLSENELSLRKMSNIAHKIKDLLDSPEFKNREEIREEFRDNRHEKDGHVYIANGGDNFAYSINTMRNGTTDKPFMIEVYLSPSDHESYTSGIGDGYFRIYFHKDHSHKIKTKKNERQALTWGNTDIHGDVYLGKETSEIIDRVSVDDLATRVHLPGVSFGGHPSIHVTLCASARGKEGDYLGPIAKINELWVLGLARARKPIEGHITDKDSETIQIDNDFDRVDRPFMFDRGSIKFQAAKTVDKSGKEVLAFRFSGMRQRFSGYRDRPINEGLEQKTIAVPLDLANGFKVIDLFEKAVDATIAACKTNPKLAAKNP